MGLYTSIGSMSTGTVPVPTDNSVLRLDREGTLGLSCVLL